MAINKSRLPIKLHYFFFMASMGPVLPWLPILAKEIGITPGQYGSVQFFVPIVYLFAKPVFGMLADYYVKLRKMIFITILLLTCGAFSIIFAMVQPKTNAIDHDIDSNSTIVGSPMQAVDPGAFWMFVVCLYVGSIGFNVVNSVSDAICFDILGENGQIHYGWQRVWGTIGFGVSAMGVWMIVEFLERTNLGFSAQPYYPVFIVLVILTALDFLCCTKLQLPPLSTSDNIFKDIRKLAKHLHIKIFLLFSTFIGIVDSFIIFYLFWFLEDFKIGPQIKLIEGLTVGAETLLGEVVFFFLSGKILKKIGFGHSFTFCFLAYSLRLGLISIIPNPWWVLAIEAFMQGPSYAMSYTTIVAYASAISPPGTSATMQGIAAGMDDGLGYSLGVALGGALYGSLGPRLAFQTISFLSFCFAVAHFALYRVYLVKKIPKIQSDDCNYNNPETAMEVVVKA